MDFQIISTFLFSEHLMQKYFKGFFTKFFKHYSMKPAILKLKAVKRDFNREKYKKRVICEDKSFLPDSENRFWEKIKELFNLLFSQST